MLSQFVFSVAFYRLVVLIDWPLYLKLEKKVLLAIARFHLPEIASHAETPSVTNSSRPDTAR